MNTQELQLAMSLFGYEIDVHYTMNEDYESISMLNEIEKPLEEQLQQALDAEVLRLQLIALQERIDNLGDIAILIDKYFQDNAGSISNDDSWNIAGFMADKINTSFGWRFQNLAKPDIDQLEAIKASLEE